MKHLRLTEEQLAAMVRKQAVRVVTPMAVPNPVRGPGKQNGKKRGRPKGTVWVDKWASELTRQIFLSGMERPHREYKFALELGRKYRADLAYPDRKLLIEVDGGAHAVRKRWHDGIIRTQIAQQLGYRVLIVMPEQVKSGEALKLIEQALAC